MLNGLGQNTRKWSHLVYYCSRLSLDIKPVSWPVTIFIIIKKYFLLKLINRSIIVEFILACYYKVLLTFIYRVQPDPIYRIQPWTSYFSQTSLSYKILYCKCLSLGPIWFNPLSLLIEYVMICGLKIWIIELYMICQLFKAN